MLKTIGAVLAALVLAAACQPKARALNPVAGDSFMGPADAKVTVIEYGAPTCPACKGWHDMFWAEVKKDYIETGKIKFVFREFPSHNPPVDAAIFALARCSGQADYFAVIDEAFARQKEIDDASHSPTGPRASLVSLGKTFGFSEQQTQSCISDPVNAQRIFDIQDEAVARGVDSTPTFFVNDKRVMSPTLDAMWPEMKTAIDAALGAP